MDLSPDDRAVLTLHLVPGIGPRLLAALTERFGSAQAVLEASVEELCEVPYVTPKLAEKMRDTLSSTEVQEELDLMQQHGVRMLRHGRPEYPASLVEIPTPPQILYIRGQIEPRDEKAVALVGSRSCSSAGRRQANILARDLARAGWTIISGLARGIDACAHRGALEAGGRTIAVVAGGLSKIYPPEHKEMAEEVVAAGALVTEAPMRMEPMAGMFPARNRIISGLSRAVVIVEAAEKSGALITARHASEQGRDVFVVPWSTDNTHGGGCLQLIRDGARLIRHAGDLIEDLEGLVVPQPAATTEPAVELGEKERAIWDYLSESRQIDEIAQSLSMPIAALSGMLLTLEMKRVVRRLPGNKFERVS